MKAVFLIRIPAKQVSKAKKSPLIQLYPTRHLEKYYLSRLSLKELKAKKLTYEILKSFSPSELPIQVIYPARSFLFDPPSQDALEEALTYAMARLGKQRRLQLQYLGRRKDPGHRSFQLDRPGGKRSYHWYLTRHPEKIKDIREQFPNLVRRIKNPNTKVIISLGSGGIRLFAHPSIFKFFDMLNLRHCIDEIWGSSGGAMAGFPYSIGVDPIVMEEEGYHVYNEKYSFRFSPSKFEVLKNLFMGTFFSNTSQTFQGFIDCQDHFRALLEKHLTVKKQKIPFFCVAYNLTKKRSEILTPDKIENDFYLMPMVQTDPVDAIIASSSIPILYAPKLIQRKDSKDAYIDGGTVEEVPLVSPYHKWKKDRAHRKEKRKNLIILSVNLFPKVEESQLFTHWLFKKIPAFRVIRVSATYADLIRQARIDEHKHLLLRDPHVTLWELTLPVTKSGVVNVKLIPEVIETAQQSFYDQLTQVEQSLS